MKTKYNQIVNVAAIASHSSDIDFTEIIALGQSEKAVPSVLDSKKILLLAIDFQNDFMEDIGSLAVSGSRKDIENTTQWIYNNIHALTQIMCSLDTHSIQQIFHPAWWIDMNGNNPPPFTIISYQDVLNGKWQASNGKQEETLEYVQNLEAKGQKQLCIWPYHCLEGSKGAQLENEFIKMVYFHSAVRSNTPIFVSKGQNPNTEMYGIIEAEYDPTGYINFDVLDTLKQFDEIYIVGEASSHCVLASVEQILAHFSTDKSMTSRFTILEDCMSPIAGFEENTIKRMHELKNKYSIKINKSTSVFL